jgi:hypothetical protein
MPSMVWAKNNVLKYGDDNSAASRRSLHNQYCNNRASHSLAHSPSPQPIQKGAARVSKILEPHLLYIQSGWQRVVRFPQAGTVDEAA